MYQNPEMPVEIQFIHTEVGYKNEVVEFINKYQSRIQMFEMATSGSTGSPKKMQFSREQIRNSALATIAKLGLNSEYTALICLNVNYVAGKMMIVRSLEAQMHALVANPASFPFDKLHPNQAVDFLALVPLQLKQMYQRNKKEDIERLNKLKILLIGGEGLSESMVQKLRVLKCTVYHSFGMTETLSHFALKNISTAQPYFEILDGVEIAIDERKCLLVKCLATNNLWIKTNDLVELVYHENTPIGFDWIGRVDNVINSGGVKINIETLENQLQTVFHQLRIDNRFFVYKLKDELLGEKVVLYIEGREFEILLPNLILELLKPMLESPYWLPKSICFIPSFATTASGKLDRRRSVEQM